MTELSINLSYFQIASSIHVKILPKINLFVTLEFNSWHNLRVLFLGIFTNPSSKNLLRTYCGPFLLYIDTSQKNHIWKTMNIQEDPT